MLRTMRFVSFWLVMISLVFSVDTMLFAQNKTEHPQNASPTGEGNHESSMQSETAAPGDRRSADIQRVAGPLAQVVKDGLVKHYRMKDAPVPSDKYPLRILLGFGYDPIQVYALVASVVASSEAGAQIEFDVNGRAGDDLPFAAGSEMSGVSVLSGPIIPYQLTLSLVAPVRVLGGAVAFNADAVVDGHKVVFEGARLEQGDGAPSFSKGSRLKWDDKLLTFDGTKWVDAPAEPGKPDFSGRWLVTLNKNLLSGQVYPAGNRVIAIEHHEPILKITWDDGRTEVTDPDGTGAKSRWEGRVLFVDQKSPEQYKRWWLSEDGTTLVNIFETMSAKRMLIFKKQNN